MFTIKHRQMRQHKVINFMLEKFKSSRTIYVAIMTGGARVKLLEQLYDIWIKEFILKPYCATVKFYGTGEVYTDNPAIKNMYINVQIIPSDYSRNHLCGKLFIAINDFLINTTADWLFRLCDDTFINMKAFNLFWKELNQNTNPQTDKLVQGNCIHKHKRTFSYIQGGSGIIFSRHSIIELNNTLNHFKELCTYVKNDDTTIGIWLRDRNYTFKSMANRYFVGHQFKQFHKIIDIIANDSLINECPSIIPRNYPKICRSFITNLKNVVFWHDRVHFLKFLPYARDFISKLPDNLYFYQTDYHPYACRGTNIVDGYLE